MCSDILSGCSLEQNVVDVWMLTVLLMFLLWLVHSEQCTPRIPLQHYILSSPPQTHHHRHLTTATPPQPRHHNHATTTTPPQPRQTTGFFIPGFPKLIRFQDHHDKIIKKFMPRLKKHLVSSSSFHSSFFYFSSFHSSFFPSFSFIPSFFFYLYFMTFLIIFHSFKHSSTSFFFPFNALSPSCIIRLPLNIAKSKTHYTLHSS